MKYMSIEEKEPKNQKGEIALADFRFEVDWVSNQKQSSIEEKIQAEYKAFTKYKMHTKGKGKQKQKLKICKEAMRPV